MIKALAKIGYAFDHQRGSHVVLRQTFEPFRRVTIPNHSEIAKGTLRKIIRETGITADDLVDLL